MKTSSLNRSFSKLTCHARPLLAGLILTCGMLIPCVPHRALASGGSATEAQEKEKAMKEAEELAEKLKAQLEKKEETLDANELGVVKQKAKESLDKEDTIRHPKTDIGPLPDPELINKMSNTPIDAARLAQWEGNPANQLAMANRINNERGFRPNSPELKAFKSSRAAEESTRGAALAQKAIDQGLRVATVNVNRDNVQRLPSPEEVEADADMKYNSPSFKNGFEGRAAASNERAKLSNNDKQIFNNLLPELQEAATSFWGKIDAGRRLPGGESIPATVGIPPTAKEDVWTRIVKLNNDVKTSAIDADGKSPALRDANFEAAQNTHIATAKSILGSWKR